MNGIPWHTDFSWLLWGHFSSLGKIFLQTSKPADHLRQPVKQSQTQVLSHLITFVWYFLLFLWFQGLHAKGFCEETNSLEWELVDVILKVYCGRLTSLWGLVSLFVLPSLHSYMNPSSGLVFVYLLPMAWICFSKKVDKRMGGNKGKKAKKNISLRKVHAKSCARENWLRIEKKIFYLCFLFMVYFNSFLLYNIFIFLFAFSSFTFVSN